jgi:tetraacyldisaccharide 4'-kinase
MLYDGGLLPVRRASIPVVSVGNVTVGGTGKTPMAAWVAQRLESRGKRAAIVMRGYGGDEPKVHARVNPEIPVIIAANRIKGIEEAAGTGATVAVLDDAFQHRGAARDVDLVLVSADNWSDNLHTLPAGPFREPLDSLARANAIIITCKAASEEQVTKVRRAIAPYARGVPVIEARLFLDQIVRETSDMKVRDVSEVSGSTVLGIAAIGNPAAMFAQLECAGASVTRRPFPDHHDFTDNEALSLADEAESHDYTICTLKDAVKLGPKWPAGARPLWYVSLAVSIERGLEDLDTILAQLSTSHGN